MNTLIRSLLVSFAITSLARAEELIAEVDLKFLKENEQVVAILCLGE